MAKFTEPSRHGTFPQQRVTAELRLKQVVSCILQKFCFFSSLELVELLGWPLYLLLKTPSLWDTGEKCMVHSMVLRNLMTWVKVLHETYKLCYFGQIA